MYYVCVLILIPGSLLNLPGFFGHPTGWDGWMASPTRWTWVWVNSGSWWWTGRPGVLRFMGSQRVGHDWATELNKKLTLFSKHLEIHIWKFFLDGSIISNSLGVKLGCLPTKFLLGCRVSLCACNNCAWASQELLKVSYILREVHICF